MGESSSVSCYHVCQLPLSNQTCHFFGEVFDTYHLKSQAVFNGLNTYRYFTLELGHPEAELYINTIYSAKTMHKTISKNTAEHYIARHI